ncbi:MAG: hypothetical protein P8Z33_13820 [Gammaproteobacteria bacterium]|jgi:hypothetical protein
MNRPASHYFIARSIKHDGKIVAERLLLSGEFASNGEVMTFKSIAAARLYASNHNLKSYSIVPVAKKLTREEFWLHVAREKRGECVG